MATQADYEKAQKIATELTDLIGQTIRDLDRGFGAPNGPIYACVMGVIDLATYNSVLDRLVKQGKIRRTTEILYWIGER